MSYTYTKTFTRTHAKYLASKVVADLYQCSLLYDHPSSGSVEAYEEELTTLLADGYVETYEFGFKRNERRVLTWHYTVGPSGDLEGDSRSGGLARGVPVYATLLGFFTLASLGLPMLSGFAGEFLVLLGAFGLSFVAGGFALVGVVLGAAYMLWMYQRVMLGRLKNVAFSQIGDVNRVELMALAPLVILVVFVGVSPGTFVSFLDGSTFYLSTYR